MNKMSFSIMIWDKETKKYEDLNTEIFAENRKDALDKFIKEKNWKKTNINKYLVAIPPICR